MTQFLENMRQTLVRYAPEGSPGRKLLQIIAVILVVEGLFVLALFSYAWVGIGVASLVIGSVMMVVLSPSHLDRIPGEDPIGVTLIKDFTHAIGNSYVVAFLGLAVIALVMVHNIFISARPEIGDLDTITIVFGGLLMVYPLLCSKYELELGFSLFFVGFVVVFLVIPQAVASFSSESGSPSVGNWYVHYMLAAPFAGFLDLIGIPASSSGNMVTIVFEDGSTQLLSISAYCAGLYSFSIFLSAFFSFVLVFERLKRMTLLLVLALGLLVAYLGNLFRMVIIGIVGYHYGLEAMLWAHENAGWVIFLGWSAVFWWLILRFISREQYPNRKSTEGN